MCCQEGRLCHVENYDFTTVKAIILRNSETEAIVLTRVSLAVSAWDRMRGLLGRRTLEEGEGMFFPDCRMIHTFFMQMAIDVVFLDADGRVLDIVSNLAPWRIAFCRKPGGRHTLELAAGGAERQNIKIGDKLHLIDA